VEATTPFKTRRTDYLNGSLNCHQPPTPSVLSRLVVLCSSLIRHMFQTSLGQLSQSRFLRKCLGRPYLLVNRWIWGHLPASVTSRGLLRAYGVHLHSLVQLRAKRMQSIGTFFFRNRPELELMILLLKEKRQGSTLDVAVLACSKGAEAYSISYAIRCRRPDLKVRLQALDIAKDILEFAEQGVYSVMSPDCSGAPSRGSVAPDGDVAANTCRDQKTSVFERMSSGEMEAMFDREADQVTVKPLFRGGITWHVGDAGHPEIIDTLGLQDIVVANRFLCHMSPGDAERCLRNIGRLVKPGGYLFVSGVDLAVRTKVARDLGWKPVKELIREIHDGDPSLRRDWPWEYWGLEPFCPGRADWQVRYASVFQLAGAL
jgi:chemotaxis methyl-accepting protein methylase